MRQRIQEIDFIERDFIWSSSTVLGAGFFGLAASASVIIGVGAFPLQGGGFTVAACLSSSDRVLAVLESGRG
jgi:hypothetical protein